jgi:hypothetical protein
MADVGQSVFGDDINSTPVSKLTMPPQPTVQSKAGQPPLEAPVYSPDVPERSRHVTFDDRDYVREIPAREKSRHRRGSRRYVAPPQPQQPVQQPYYDLRPLPPAPPAPRTKLQRAADLLRAWGHQLAVFAIVLAALWNYARMASWPYVGNGAALTSLGTVAISLSVAGVYGVIKHVID